MTSRLVSLFLRAFALVALTAANVRQIGQGHYAGAFACGAAISFVWFLNVGKASDHRDWISAGVYAFGAGCGTLCGMWLAG